MFAFHCGESRSKSQRVKTGEYSQGKANIITGLVLLWLPREPLQLHGSAADPRRDGAPGRGAIPSSGAQQQTPLSQELLLPQEWHLHTVSSPPAPFRAFQDGRAGLHRGPGGAPAPFPASFRSPSLAFSVCVLENGAAQCQLISIHPPSARALCAPVTTFGRRALMGRSHFSSAFLLLLLLLLFFVLEQQLLRGLPCQDVSFWPISGTLAAG